MRQLEQARAELFEARRRWGEHADLPEVARWFASMAFVDYLAGCFGAALKDAAYARRMTADGDTLGTALRVIGCIEIQRGFQEAGERRLRECAELRAGSAPAMAAADLGWSLVQRGVRGEGFGLLSAGAAHDGDGEAAAWTRAVLARGLIALARLEDARRELERVEEHGYAWIQVGLATSELALALGRPADALGHTGRLLDRLDESGVRAYQGDALIARAAALERLGLEAELAAVREQALELAMRLGAGRLLEALA